VIAKSSRLERQVLKALQHGWALMPCHLSCYIYIPTPGRIHPGARTCWEISVEFTFRVATFCSYDFV